MLVLSEPDRKYLAVENGHLDQRIVEGPHFYSPAKDGSVYKFLACHHYHLWKALHDRTMVLRARIRNVAMNLLILK